MLHGGYNIENEKLLHALFVARMSSLINMEGALDAFITKLCTDEMLLQRLRTALFPDVTQETLEPTTVSYDSSGVAVVNPSSKTPTLTICSESDTDSCTVSSCDEEDDWVCVHDCPSTSTETSLVKPLIKCPLDPVDINAYTIKRPLDPIGINATTNNDNLYDVEQRKPFDIKIKNIFGKVITINVEPRDTVATVKAKIYKSEEDRQSLYLYRNRNGSTFLSDHEELGAYNIDQTSILYLFPPDDGHGSRINITVKTLTGKTIAMNVHPTDTIMIVKAKIYEAIGHPPDYQRIIFVREVPGCDKKDVKRLWNADVLNDVGVHEDSILHMCGHLSSSIPKAL